MDLLGRGFTKKFLERYGRMLIEKWNKSRYKHKGYLQTTIKMVYGEVTYSGAVYGVTEEEGYRHHVYLLDETLELENIGLICTNKAELLIKSITELSYRESTSKISEMKDRRSVQWVYSMLSRRLERGL